MKKLGKFNYSDRNKVSRVLVDSRGQRYGKMLDGSQVKLSPRKPWRNKAERRVVLANRRADRAAAAANLQS